LLALDHGHPADPESVALAAQGRGGLECWVD
jgi:hypothetical protein